MAKTSYNSLYQQQQSKLVRATFKKGVITDINASAGTASVSIVGNQSTVLKNVPFASHINPLKIMIGDRCRLDLFDETNPSDMVIAYVYGRPIPVVRTASGSSEFQASGGTSQVFTHGLGVLPQTYGIQQTNLQVYSGETWTLRIVAIDENTFTVNSNPDDSKFLFFNWWVAAF